MRDSKTKIPVKAAGAASIFWCRDQDGAGGVRKQKVQNRWIDN